LVSISLKGRILFGLDNVPVSGVYGEAGRVRLVRVRLVAHPAPVQQSGFRDKMKIRKHNLKKDIFLKLLI
jgi:hypothetical protein